jgi:hypothetical protein
MNRAVPGAELRRIFITDTQLLDALSRLGTSIACQVDIDQSVTRTETTLRRRPKMNEQDETPIDVLPTSDAVEAVIPVAADRLYQFAALTAGFLLLISLL